MSLLDLPVDVLLLVFPYLDVPSFLSLTATCRALHNPDILEYPGFWQAATRNTFRVPNNPVAVAQSDGKRWQKLYKRLRTQTHVFTWGSNQKANLGHSYESREDVQGLPPALRRRRAIRGRLCSWPKEMDYTEELGIVADLQAGGWSTTLLTSKGVLHTVGVLDGLQFNQRVYPYMQEMKRKPTRLSYPPGYIDPHVRYDSATAIQQFSAGRSHVLGLSDDGKIWSWNDIGLVALNVKFLNVEMRDDGGRGNASAVRKVVAGWNKSAAFVAGAGIVIWDIFASTRDEADIEDTALVLETALVPHSGFQRSKHVGRTSTTTQSTESEHIGEVLNFICLEHFVVFHTHHGKIYASKITWTDQQKELSDLVEVPIPTPTSTSDSSEVAGPPPLATDIQGSFRSFAIFTTTDQVFTGSQDYLQSLFDHNPRATPLTLAMIPALQQKGVISMAFGDYHFHALHSDGHITSYGTEAQACGSLGLGGHGDPEGRIRGLRYEGISRDGRLVPHAYSSGRRVWFEEGKNQWIRFLVSGGKNPEEARERMRMCAELPVQAEVSEWIEQEGRCWEAKYAPKEPADEDDGLPTHFALSITAAGWHSGALVLVNKDRAAKVREGCIVRREPPESGATDQSDPDIESPQAAQSYVATALEWTAGWARWFLGYPASAPGAGNANPTDTAPPRRSDFLDPVNHGAALDKNSRYAWADDSFPRLELADGRVMPGEVDITQWRLGRPEWDLGYVVP